MPFHFRALFLTESAGQPERDSDAGQEGAVADHGMEYYRQVKIAGEDVVEEPVAEPALDAIPGYDEETRLQYAGGLPEDTGEETLAE